MVTLRTHVKFVFMAGAVIAFSACAQSQFSPIAARASALSSVNPASPSPVAPLDSNGNNSGSSGSTAGGNSCAQVYYNFVSSDQSSCQSAIYSRLGVQASCSIGGGCSISAGPATANNPSANPEMWGACISAPSPSCNEDDSSPCQQPQQQPQQQQYNFVASNEATCENSILNRLGIVQACTIGGGCAINGGVPTASNPSANPGMWGACITH